MGIKQALKIITIQLLLFLALACSDDSQNEAKYVGSRNSNIYHYTDCKWAKKISSRNLIEFYSVREAKSAGYRACKVCKPPVKDY